MSNNNCSESIRCDIKSPKKVLYFSDGVLEEYDSEEDIKDTKDSVEKQIVLKNMPLMSYLANTFLWVGNQTLRVCDYIGENLANFFGITTPKYQSEIDEYNRITEEENNYQIKRLSDFSGWTQTDSNKQVLNCVDIKDKSNTTAIDLEKQKF